MATKTLTVGQALDRIRHRRATRTARYDEVVNAAEKRFDAREHAAELRLLDRLPSESDRALVLEMLSSLDANERKR